MQRSNATERCTPPKRAVELYTAQTRHGAGWNGDVEIKKRKFETEALMRGQAIITYKMHKIPLDFA